MKIHDVLNMSAAELKANKADAVKALSNEPSESVAARCFQCLLDAKMRDEKLAEQGATITNLNAALQSHERQLAETKSVRDELHRQCDHVYALYQSELEKNSKLSSARERLQNAVQRNDSAITDIVRIAQQAIDAKLAAADELPNE